LMLGEGELRAAACAGAVLRPATPLCCHWRSGADGGHLARGIWQDLSPAAGTERGCWCVVAAAVWQAGWQGGWPGPPGRHHAESSTAWFAGHFRPRVLCVGVLKCSHACIKKRSPWLSPGYPAASPCCLTVPCWLNYYGCWPVIGSRAPLSRCLAPRAAACLCAMLAALPPRRARSSPPTDPPHAHTAPPTAAWLLVLIML
jgi:hypothetical protein